VCKHAHAAGTNEYTCLMQSCIGTSEVVSCRPRCLDFFLVPSLGVSPGEKQSGEQSQISVPITNFGKDQ